MQGEEKRTWTNGMAIKSGTRCLLRQRSRTLLLLSGSNLSLRYRRWHAARSSPHRVPARSAEKLPRDLRRHMKCGEMRESSCAAQVEKLSAHIENFILRSSCTGWMTLYVFPRPDFRTSENFLKLERGNHVSTGVKTIPPYLGSVLLESWPKTNVFPLTGIRYIQPE